MATSNYLYKLLDTISVRNAWVGIGTDDPLGHLHVKGKALFDDAFVGGTLSASNLHIIGESTLLNTTTSNTEQLFITNIGTGPALRVTQAGIGSQFSVAEFIDAETNMAFKVADTGLIGINTNSPIERLHMYDASNVSMLIESDGPNIHTTEVRLQNAAGSFTMGLTNSQTVDLLSTAEQPLRIGTHSNVILYMTPSGNVGIASTEPKYQLDVGSFGVRDIFDIRNSGTHRYTHGYGGIQYNTIGAHQIGLRITWSHPTTSHIYSFRIAGKFHITSETSTNAFRRFESLVTPVNDIMQQFPCQQSLLDLIDFKSGNGFTNITHTITRHNEKSVNVIISWNASVSPTIAYLDLDMMAHTALGDFQFEPISV